MGSLIIELIFREFNGKQSESDNFTWRRLIKNSCLSK